LVPTTARTSAPSAEASAAIADHVRSELQKRTKRFDAAVTIRHAPERFEIAVAGRTRDLSGILAAVASVMASRAPAGLEAARDRVAAAIDRTRAVDLAVETVVDALVGRGDRVDAERTRSLARADLVQAWEELADPRALVLLVHAGVPAEDAKADLRKLASHWRGVGKRDMESEAVARLRRAAAPEPPKTRLLADPAAPLAVARVSVDGPAHLVLGRVVATPNPRTRSLARLAQRVAQEDIEISIAFAGEFAIVLVQAPLGGKPEKRARDVVARLGELATTRQPRQRLFQAATLWLGARVVEASLAGEDWTALLASAFELSDRDADVAAALARDARQMLEVDADALHAWTKAWLDPKAGTPGWTWAVAGASEADARELARLAPTR
jgi:hypothetical protein